VGEQGPEQPESIDHRIQPPDTTKEEVGASILTGLLGFVPVAGSALAEVVSFAGQRVIERRVNAFYEAVIRDLDRLHVQVDKLEESFWMTFLHALEAARRTHQQEKFEALKNAVVNAARPTAPDDDLQHIFVNMVDELTPTHLRRFGFLLHPEKFGMALRRFRELHGLNPYNPRAAWDAIEANVAPGARRDVVQRCFSDLVNRGLLQYSSDPGPLQGAVLPWPATIGWDFYNFITSHDEPLNGNGDSTTHD
jgi:hypothetical protein